MMSRFQIQVWLLAMVIGVGLCAAPLAPAEEKPRYAGCYGWPMPRIRQAWTRTRNKPSR